jgi:hypothetical protein
MLDCSIPFTHIHQPRASILVDVGKAAVWIVPDIDISF